MKRNHGKFAAMSAKRFESSGPTAPKENGLRISSKPWRTPKSSDTHTPPTYAIARHFAHVRTSESVGTDSTRRNDAKSRAPCSEGGRPVSSEATLGPVHAAH